MAKLHVLNGPWVQLALLPALVWRIRPDVILSTPWDLNIVVLMLKWFFPRKIAIVVREAIVPLSSVMETRFPKFWRTLYRLIYPTADSVVVLSESMKRVLLATCRVQTDRVTVISNAVSPGRIDVHAEQYSSPTIVAVGRLAYQKGYDLLLRSMPRMLAEMPDLCLKIIGEGEERLALERLIETLGLRQKVLLCGAIENPLSAVVGADLFVSCSRYEGLSNAMLEALCCGVPVAAVVGNNSVSDVIVHGRNGFLIPSHTQEAIANGILDALRNSPMLNRKEIAAECQSKYTVDRQAAMYDALFLRLTNSKHFELA